MACGEHVDDPLLFAVSGGIEVRAPREFYGGESVDDKHRGAAVGAVPVGGGLRGGGGRRAIARQQLLAEREAAGAESVRKETKIPDSDEPLRQYV